MKHEAHVCDGGGVPAQWLVEGPRFLPRVASRAHGAVRAGGREAGGSDRRRCIIWDYDDRFEPSDQQIWGAERGKHTESSAPETSSSCL